MTKRWGFSLAVLSIALVAFTLRVAALDRLPPGLFGDEAVEGLDALDVLAGNLNIWFHAHLGREPLYVYLTALSYALFDVTPFATRLPALIAGLLTIPATFWFVREWASQIFPRARATRLALLTTALLAISFWHVQMTRNAHRDTLLPLVEAVGYALLWRAFRMRSRRALAAAGAVLGLAIYTYSPGRFVSVFVALFILVEVLIALLTTNRRPQTNSKAEGGRMKDEPSRQSSVSAFILHPSAFGGLALAALCAILVMLPLGVYFTQNPAQFTRRFDSTSFFDAANPSAALAASVAGNLAQFVVPGMGYQSKHYNLPGKPIFDLFVAPWFLAGIAIACMRARQPPYRFLLLWFGAMCVPAFLTADMIPKGVRVLGVVPGVFVFPALAIEWATEKLKGNRQKRLPFLTFNFLLLTFVGSAAWTAYDYFVAWANLPELPLAFDTDQVEVAAFIQRQPRDLPIYISQEVYRPPTLMLLGERVPTSRYVDRATRFKESDAHTALIFGVGQADAIYIFVRDYVPAEEWFARVAPASTPVGHGKYFVADRLGAPAPPLQSLDVEFNPLLRLIGVSRYNDGIVLYWRVVALPADRAETHATLTLFDARGAPVARHPQRFGVPPLEWANGDVFVEWHAFDVPAHAAQFSVELTRGASIWRAPMLSLR